MDPKWAKEGVNCEPRAHSRVPHLQPLKEAPPEKMPSVASCRCSLEPKRHLADWGGSGAYVFIGLTSRVQHKGRLQRAGAGRARSAPKVSEPVVIPVLSRPHSHLVVANFPLLDAQPSWFQPLFPARGQKVLGRGGNRSISDDILSADS